MLALARYTLKGPYYAAAVVAALTILSVLFPLLSVSPFSALLTMLLTVVAGVLVGLIILTQGIQSGLKAIIASILGITAISTVFLQAPGLGISVGLIQWLPVIALAQTLRVSNSLALTLLAGIVVGAVMVVTQFMIWPNLATDWTAMAQQALVQLPQTDAYQDADLSEFISRIMHWLTRGLVGSLYVMFVAIVILSCWLQGRLAESDGFRQELYGLALGKSASIVAVILFGLSVWLEQDWLISLAILVSVAFLFQGIAVIHSKLMSNRFRPILTALFYILLLIIPQVMALTIIIGIIDNWLFFRKPKNEN